MADEKKYIKTIKLDSTNTLTIKDGEAIHTINGYDLTSIEDQTVQFANSPITETEINSLFA
jgi:hypothetical protein